MDAVMGGSAPNQARWGAFKNYARAYNTFAGEYVKLTGERNINLYDVAKMKGSMDTVWPVQKEIFDTIYADTLALSGLLVEYDVGISVRLVSRRSRVASRNPCSLSANSLRCEPFPQAAGRIQDALWD